MQTKSNLPSKAASPEELEKLIREKEEDNKNAEKRLETSIKVLNYKKQKLQEATARVDQRTAEWHKQPVPYGNILRARDLPLEALWDQEDLLKHDLMNAQNNFEREQSTQAKIKAELDQLQKELQALPSKKTTQQATHMLANPDITTVSLHLNPQEKQQVLAEVQAAKANPPLLRKGRAFEVSGKFF